MATTFENLRDALHGLLRSKHADHDVRLLNVGSDRPLEHHWRIRTSSGEIVTVRITSGID